MIIGDTDMIEMFLVMDNDQNKYVYYSQVKHLMQTFISNSGDCQRYSLHSMMIMADDFYRTGQAICSALIHND